MILSRPVRPHIYNPSLISNTTELELRSDPDQLKPAQEANLICEYSPRPNWLALSHSFAQFLKELKVTRYEYEAHKRALALGIDHYPFDPKKIMALPLEAPTRARPDIALPWPLCAACNSLN